MFFGLQNIKIKKMVISNIECKLHANCSPNFVLLEVRNINV